jgi:hypothetical protein
MISDEALLEFKQIWVDEFGEEISDEVATEEAINLLTMFDAVYRPIKQEWITEYEDENANDVKNQPISASCKSGAAK